MLPPVSGVTVETRIVKKLLTLLEYIHDLVFFAVEHHGGDKIDPKHRADERVAEKHGVGGAVKDTLRQLSQGAAW